MSRTRRRNGEIRTQACTSGVSLAKCFPDWADRAGEAVLSVYLNVYLQKGDDERSQGKVGGFLQLGVEFFNGEGGILEQRENT